MLCLAQVSYPGLFPLAPGDSLAVSEAREIPSIRLEEASKDKLYTVGRFSHHLPPTRYLPPPAMVDPDAPSRKNPRAAQWLHWIFTNVDGKERGRQLCTAESSNPGRVVVCLQE